MIDATPVREFFQAFLASDFEAMSHWFANDATIAIAGKSKFAGEHRGREAVTSVFRELAELRPKLPDTWDICVSDDHAILMDWFTASSDGREFVGYIAFVCAIESQRIARVFPFFEEQYSFDEYFS